jgi:hypothetical protein
MIPFLALEAPDLNTRIFWHFAALTCVFASTSMAGLVGSTYNFSGSATGNTQIGATAGTHTDPANAGFCVGPPVACGVGSGVSGGYGFADINPSLAEITFSFFGSTSGAGPGSFSIKLSNFSLPGGGAITGITFSNGTMAGFNSVTWDGTNAVFTGSTGSDYNAIGGTNAVFDVSLTAPEPGSLLLMTTALGGLVLAIRKRRHQA